jgi:hypothetical protein
MVEAIANGIEDKLIDGLSFRLNPGASYVTDRRSVTFHPQGSNIYTPGAGTKLIRIVLTGDSWLDPSTFRVMFNLVNEEALDATPNMLRPIGGPWGFFQRMRVLCAGQLVEDIMDYNRIHQMMHVLIAQESRDNDASEAFGLVWDNADTLPAQVNTDNYNGIAPGESLTVLFKPLSGILNQGKMLPIRYAPITIELELVSDATAPIVSTYGIGAKDFKAENTSTKWSINNVQVKCDLCTLDNALDNSYAQHLLSGKSLPISFNTFVSQMQTISGPDVSINVSRALTRLKSVFVTLEKGYSTDGRDAFALRKAWKDFFSPMSFLNRSGILKHDPRGEFEFQLQIGSKLFPEYPIRSHNEAFYQLKKTLGVQASAVHNFDVTATQYRDSRFILGTDCERILDAGFTGLNTRAGDLMTVKFKNASSGFTTNGTECLADRLHVVLHSDQIMEIRDSGVQVFD